MQMNNVPNGWSIKKLGDICIMFSGGTPSTKNRAYWENGTIRWLSAKHLENDKILNYEYITQEGLQNSSAKLAKENDIILVTRVSVGKMLFCEKGYAINQDLSVIRAADYIVPKYLFFCLKNIIPIITHKSQGLAIKGITKSELANIQCVVPPIAEQKKIAEILGTWDRAIEELSDLITEKKELKRGLMQQLLTGTKRLPGFNMAWKEIKCSDVLFERKTYLSKGKELEHVSLTKEGVVPKTARYERDFLVKGEEKEYKITKLNDICYNPANLKFGVICRNTYGDGIFSPIYVTFEVKNMDVVLLGFIVETHMFQGKALRYEQGTVYERMAVGAEDLLRVKLTMPSDMAEQKAIADVLTKADAEIDLLNQQLDVLKEQKRGLMQKLLTGEIRVKVDTETC